MTTAIEYALMAGASYISTRPDVNKFPVPQGVPYIATYPAGCIAYNKWDRPATSLLKSSYSVEGVNAENHDISTPEYKTILREALPRERCPQYSSSPKAPIPIAPSTPKK